MRKRKRLSKTDEARGGLTPREQEVQAAILGDLEAERAFRRLVANGFPENALLANLCIEAWGPDTIWEQDARRNGFRCRAEITEMSDKLLRKAERLRREARRFPQHIARNSLREARQAMSDASSLRAPAWDRPPIREIRGHFTRNFAKEVERRTGHQSLNQVAALLRVSHQLAGRGEKVSCESLRSQLKMNW